MTRESKPKCVLHIGVHKTGSSSFQFAMSRAREALNDARVLYPAQPGLAFDKFVAHHGLAEQLTGNREDTLLLPEVRGLTLDELESEIDTAKPHYLVLSAETFSVPFTDNVDESSLIKLLLRKGFDISVVAMIRPQVELIQSSYVEGVMALFNYVKFAEYVRAAIGSPYFDYVSRLAPWSQSKATSFVAVPYVNRVDEENIVTIVLRAGGIPPKVINSIGISRVESINQNPGAMTVAAVRWFVPHLHKLQYSPFRDELKAFILAEAERRDWTSVPYAGYSGEIAKILDAKFRRSNSEFAHAHWGKDWEQVFPPRAAGKGASNEVDFDTISTARREEFDAFQKLVEAKHASLWLDVAAKIISESGLTTTVALPNCTLTFTNGILTGKTDG